jgi:AraC-like DNA-binding protein
MALRSSSPPVSYVPTLATAGAVPEGMVGVGMLIPVPSLLEEHGVDPVTTLAEFGIDRAYLENPENTIPFATKARVLSRCAALTRCPHFGLLVGQRSSSSSLGTLGFLMRSAPDVRTAVEVLTRRFRVHSVDAVMASVQTNAVASVSYHILPTGIVGLEHLLDAAMALSFNMMRALCGAGWHPVEVRFGHARPEDAAPYRAFFGAPLHFDEGETALYFGSGWLQKKLPDADPIMHRMMAQRVSELEAGLDESLAVRLARMLPSLMATGGASLAEVGRLVGLAPRTLNRRLAAEGTSVMRLRDDAIRVMAFHLLAHTRMSIGEIADRLGYANPSAFDRAFHRWEAMAPLQWRESRGLRAVARS